MSGPKVVDGNVTSPDANKRGVRSVFLPVAIVLGRKPSSNLRRILSGRAMATAYAPARTSGSSGRRRDGPIREASEKESASPDG
jgi:hypothetical protein